LRGCVVYLCASGSEAGADAARRVAAFWERVIGAAPVLIDAEAHDRQLAWTSHLPQAVASALANALADRGLTGVSFGAGAKDTTRLAGSSPEMWVDILLQNGPDVAEAVVTMEQQLQRLRALLDRRDATGLREFLAAAQRFRQGIDR
jgi:prephenate dehydrogenase